MANNKLKILPLHSAAGLQPEAGSALDPGYVRDSGPSADEGLRLIRAFSRIGDPRRRAWLLDQVERLAELKSTMQ
jgi:hypothetical protein